MSMQSISVGNTIVLAPQDQAQGLVQDVKRNSIRMLRITDIELRLYTNLSKRSADAQSFCMFAAGIAISVFTTMATTEIGRPVLIAVLTPSVILTAYFAKSWYREAKSAASELKSLMSDIAPDGLASYAGPAALERTPSKASG